MSQTHFIIPVFIPHSGCPSQCVFCNQKNITGVMHVPTPDDVFRHIASYLDTIGNRGRRVLVAFYGGNFTGLDMNRQVQYLKVVNRYLYEKKIDSIRISTRPDCIDTDILAHLRRWNVGEIELGIQSFNDSVLQASKRGYTAQQAVRASMLIREHGFLLGHQIMVGLPGDSWQAIISTAKTSVSLYPDMLRIYPTLVMKDTELANLSDYDPLSLDDAVERTAFLLEYYTRYSVRVLRVGLHPPKDISVVLGGPYHESFNFLVKSYMWNMFFSNLQAQIESKKIHTIVVSPVDFDVAIGYRKSNMKVIGDKCMVKKVSWLVRDHIVLVSESNKKIHCRRKDFQDSYLNNILTAKSGL